MNMPTDGNPETFVADSTADPAASGQSPDGLQAEPTDGSAPAAPVFDPKQYEINFKGQKIYPKDRAHLQTLIQKGYSASQAMEALNQEKAALSQQREKYGKYEMLDKTLSEHPDFGQKIWDLQQQYQSGLNNGEDETDPHVAAFKKELSEIKSRLSARDEQDAKTAVDKEINDLKTKYSDYTWDTDEGEGTLEHRVIKHALDNNISSLTKAFRDLMFDDIQNRAKADGLRQAKDTRQQMNKQGVVANGRQAPPPTPQKKGYQPGKSYNDLAQDMIKEVSGG